jgi:hypothetical protein
VDLNRIVAELRSEQDRIDRVIGFLENTVNGAKPIRAGRASSKGAGGYWKSMSSEQRSAEMRRRAMVRAKNQMEK